MRLFSYVFFVLTLVACVGGANNPGGDLYEQSKHFSEAMRWGDYIGAGRHLQPDVREELLAMFQENEDLRTVSSSVYSIDLEPGANVADVEYRLEYYRLPSMRVKKWIWRQQWKLQRNKGIKSDLWLIVNSPPSVP